MLGCKLVMTPMEQKLKLSKYEGEELKDPSSNKRLIGRLLYSTIIRPDITFAVHRLSRLKAHPRKTHLLATNRVLQYLKAILGHGLIFLSNSKLHIKHLQMQIGLHALTQEGLLLGSMCSLGIFFSFMDVQEATNCILIFSKV